MAHDASEHRPLLPDVEKNCTAAAVAAPAPARASRAQRWRLRIVQLLYAALGAAALCWLAAPTTSPSSRDTQAPRRIRHHRPGRAYDAYTATGSHGAVATENEICSDMGVDGTWLPEVCDGGLTCSCYSLEEGRQRT